MIILSFVAALLFVVMLCVVIDKYGVPDMVSSIYYLLGKRGWLFQLVLVLFGAMMMACLLDSELGEPCLAFLACAGLIFVGMAPRFLEESERGLHKGSAIVSAVASVAWCLTVNMTQAMIAIALYLCFGTRKHPLYWAEITAILLVFWVYIFNI